MEVDRERVVSTRPPYLPVSVILAGQAGPLQFEALIDTGFDGEVIVPPTWIPREAVRDGGTTWRLADGSRVRAPNYLGALHIGSMRVSPVSVSALGNEPIIGRGVTQRFTVTFDHDRRVIVEP